MYGETSRETCLARACEALFVLPTIIMYVHHLPSTCTVHSGCSWVYPRCSNHDVAFDSLFSIIRSLGLHLARHHPGRRTALRVSWKTSL